MRKVITSGMVGNGLEWYDYALYGQLAFIMEDVFFPENTGGLKALVIFAVGFLARPFGGFVFGWLGDRIGRNRSLSLSIIIMALSSCAIGLLPGYEQIGIFAPIALVIIRLLQGLSVGGEFSCAIVYMVEHADIKRRGLVGSAAVISLVLGFLAGSLVNTLLSSLMTPEQFQEWGWRIPFLLGSVIGLIGFYIRNHCGESPIYKEAKAQGLLSKNPLKEVFSDHLGTTLKAVGIYLTVTIPFYFASVFFILMNKNYLGLDSSQALQLNTTSMVMMLCAIPVAAILSDKFGRRAVMLVCGCLFLVFTYPLFMQMQSGLFDSIRNAELAFSFMVGLYISAIPALLTEMFPTSVRNTGMAISYNIAAALFGGTAPIVGSMMFDETQLRPLLVSYNTTPFEAIAYYIMLAGVISVVTLFFYKDRSRQPLL